MALKNGTTVFIESKEFKDKLSPLQELRINELNENGFIAFALQDKKGITHGNKTFENELHYLTK